MISVFKNLYKYRELLKTNIKKEIRENQITGGMLGIYNPSITQRLNNLVEKVEDVTPQAPMKLIIKVNRSEDS